MRISNRKKIPFYKFILTLLLILLLLGFFLFFIEYFFIQKLGWINVFTIIIPAFLLIIYFIRGRQIFEYDSDGETITIKNNHIIMLLAKKLHDEFPKYKLIEYNIIDLFIYKRLYIKISSKKSDVVILKYDISFLTYKELKDISFSLRKTIKNNLDLKDFQ